MQPRERAHFSIRGAVAQYQVQGILGALDGIYSSLEKFISWMVGQREAKAFKMEKESIENCHGCRTLVKTS